MVSAVGELGAGGYGMEDKAVITFILVLILACMLYPLSLILIEFIVRIAWFLFKWIVWPGFWLLLAFCGEFSNTANFFFGLVGFAPMAVMFAFHYDQDGSVD